MDRNDDGSSWDGYSEWLDAVLAGRTVSEDNAYQASLNAALDELEARYQAEQARGNVVTYYRDEPPVYRQPKEDR